MGGMNSAKIVISSMLFAAAILTSELVSCDGPTDEQCFTYHRVSGVVRDSGSGEFLDSVMISLHDTSGVSAYTDTLGEYLAGASGCDMTVIARKPGYATKFRVFIGLQADLTGINFDLAKR